ncbi:ABC transporter substrate-binding protein [Alloiococcus sp. CFN-8]|uniref:ABC transporter substrate-binding protein n=1 Tax=Alloiococcus sp. CFN-8 TaxID=3416081 RepID=UPI003CF83F15
MFKIGKLLLPVLGIMLMATGCASAPQKASGSATGKDMKIVATSVAICEILDELGFDNVIGIPETSNSIPEKYAKLTTVGSPMNPDLEIIKSLSPDLVLSPKSLEASLSESYRAAGITSAFLDLSSVEGMYSAINSLGELLHCQEAAKRLNDDYKTYIEGYREGSEEKKEILLLMAFPDGFYLVATENSYVGNLVKLAGGNNVYDSSYNGDENGFVNINPEDIVQKKPDHIFVFAHYAEEDAFKFMEQEFSSNKTWQYFEAVQEGKISYLPSEYFGMSATLSWTDSLEYLSPIFKGESK